MAIADYIDWLKAVVITFVDNREIIMDKRIMGLILASTLLFLAGCGKGGGLTEAYLRPNVSLAHIETVAVLPFEGVSGASRIREFAITQILVSGIFDVVDKGRVDSLMQQEGIALTGPLDSFTIRRLCQQLNVQAAVFGSVEQTSDSRGSAVFPEIVMTLRLIDGETGVILWQASGKKSGYSAAHRLIGVAPKDSFALTMELFNDLFATMK